jgi:L-seryl-tRNA(Ser) seleniumtransferase
MVESDPRRSIPRTDRLLALPDVIAAGEHLNQATIKALVNEVQTAARAGRIPVAEVVPTLISKLVTRTASSLTPVLNATGILVHTNLGRAPLSPAATRAVTEAAGYVDVEMDLAAGKRSKRGTGAKAALLRACPAAEDALVVNNGAAGLLLAVTALRGAASGREIVVSRGELIEIGAGFRLTDLMTTTGARLHEVGTTNRTHLADYAEAIGEDTSCLLKVHTSNFRVEGFTASVEVSELAGLAREHDLPLIVDLGSGLFTPDEALPDEPDIDAALRAGADLVIVSGDKLLGGPQAGLVLGRAEAVQTAAEHPLARALRNGQAHPRRPRSDDHPHRQPDPRRPPHRPRPAAGPHRGPRRGGRCRRRRPRRSGRRRGSPGSAPARLGGRTARGLRCRAATRRTGGRRPRPPGPMPRRLEMCARGR